MIGGCRIGRDVGDKGELLGGRSEEDVVDDSTVDAVLKSAANYNNYAKRNNNFWYTDKEQPIGLREAIYNRTRQVNLEYCQAQLQLQL